MATNNDPQRTAAESQGPPVTLTERLREEADAHRESEQRYRDLFDHANDLIQCVASDGSFVYVNNAWKKTLGYDEADVARLSLFDIIHADCLEGCRETFQRVMAGEKIESVEVTLLAKDGHPVVVEGSTSCRFDAGIPVSTRGIFRDITDRRKTEESLKSKQRHLQQVFNLQERERRLVSHDIHDGLVQYVVGARMRIEAHLVQLRASDDSSHLDVAISLLDRAVKEARRIMGELRPLIMDEQGILEAIRYLVNDERFCAGLKVSLVSDVQFHRLDPVLEGALFRIVQEALTNVKRHSGAARASVLLTEESGSLRMEIRDDGAGFDPERVPEDRFGVRGIEERAQLFGGTATIESVPGRGTRVVVRVPLAAEQAH